MTESKQVVVTQFTYVNKGAIDLPDKVSVTIPDQGYTIADLLERHRQGILTDVGRTPIYLGDDEDGSMDFDDEDYEKLNHSDLVDKQAVLDRLKADTEEGKRQDQEKAQKRKEAALQKPAVRGTSRPQAEKEREPKTEGRKTWREENPDQYEEQNRDE